MPAETPSAAPALRHTDLLVIGGGMAGLAAADAARGRGRSVTLLEAGPVVGGLALLMFTGTGGENTDVGAHLMGFVCGFGAGLAMVRLGNVPRDPKTQRAAGAIAVGLIVVSWIVALSV